MSYSYDFITVISANLLKYLSEQHLAKYLLFLRQTNYKNKRTVFFIFKDMPEVRDAINQYFILYGDDNRDHDGDYWNNYDEMRFSKRKLFAHTCTNKIGILERAISEGLIFELSHINNTYKGKEYVFIKSEKLYKIKSQEAAKRSEEYRLMLSKDFENIRVASE